MTQNRLKYRIRKLPLITAFGRKEYAAKLANAAPDATQRLHPIDKDIIASHVKNLSNSGINNLGPKSAHEILAAIGILWNEID